MTHADFTGEGPVRLVKDILRRDFDSLTQVLACEEEVEGGRGDDDFGVLVDFGIVEVRDDFFDLGYGAVPTTPTSVLCIVVILGRGESYILKLPPTKNWRGLPLPLFFLSYGVSACIV